MEWIFDMSEVDATMTALREGLDGMPSFEVSPGPGDEAKAAAGVARGDSIYPVTDDLVDALTEGFASALMEGGGFESAGYEFLEGVKANIFAGMVEGPPRSPAWVSKKGNDTNMVGLTQSFASNLQVSFSSSGSAGGFVRA